MRTASVENITNVVQASQNPCFDCVQSTGNCPVCVPKYLPPSPLKIPFCALCIYRNCRDTDVTECVECIQNFVP